MPLMPGFAAGGLRSALTAGFAVSLSRGLLRVLVMSVFATFAQTEQRVIAALLAHALNVAVVASNRALVALCARRARARQRLCVWTTLRHALSMLVLTWMLPLLIGGPFAIPGFAVLAAPALFPGTCERSGAMTLVRSFCLVLRGAARAHTNTDCDCDDCVLTKRLHDVDLSPSSV
ncbi:MAG: hypothetical protein QM778_17840 [Myxococcales bacterium]